MSTASKTLRVRDVMTHDVITMAASTSLADASRSLTFHRIGGVPVIDKGRIVGVLSKTDLVDPSHRGAATVGDAMTHLVFAVRPGDAAMSAVRLMAEEGVHRIVVVEEHGKLAGMVTAMDILKAMARGCRVQEHDYAAEEGDARHAEPASAVGYVDLRALPVALP